MLQLYTYWRSSASFRVRIALNVKGIAYESCPVHLIRDGGEQNLPAYRQLNPQGRVPTLVHDGAVINQSMAILEYLEEVFPSPALLPDDPAGRARVRGLAQIIVSDIQPLQNSSVTRYLSGTLQLDKAAINAWLHHWISRGLEAVEARLAAEPATGRYCHGAAVSLADCCLYPQVYAARRFGVDLAAFPTIARIAAECARVAAFAQAEPDQQPDRE